MRATAQAATADAVRQGIRVATGLQDKFNWKGVVATGTSAADSGGRVQDGNSGSHTYGTINAVHTALRLQPTAVAGSVAHNRPAVVTDMFGMDDPGNRIMDVGPSGGGETPELTTRDALSVIGSQLLRPTGRAQAAAGLFGRGAVETGKGLVDLGRTYLDFQTGVRRDILTVLSGGESAREQVLSTRLEQAKSIGSALGRFGSLLSTQGGRSILAGRAANAFVEAGQGDINDIAAGLLRGDSMIGASYRGGDFAGQIVFDGATAPLAALKVRNVRYLGGVNAVRNVESSVDNIRFLFRGDTRGPEFIFRNGFQARGVNTDLLRHAAGELDDSAYVPTSRSQNIAQTFARDGARNSYDVSHVYEIDYELLRLRGVEGIDVNAVLGSRSPHPTELELAIPDGIPPWAIRSSRPVGVNGSLGRDIINPNYIGKNQP